MLSSIRSNQPYANEHVYIFARSWMADDVTAACAVRSRDTMGDDFSAARWLGVGTVGGRCTNTAGRTNPYQNVNITTIILESPASPTPSDDDSKLAAPLKGECDPEFVGYGVTTSPSTSDTDSLPELRAVSALPKGLQWVDPYRPPTNGTLVLVFGWWRRWKVPWRGGRLRGCYRPPRQMCDEHVL